MQDPSDRQSLMSLSLALALAESRHRAAEASLAQAQQTVSQLHEELAQSREATHHAQHEANYDALTGLSNRRAFSQRSLSTLREPDARARGLCLLYVDLDGFKLINDGLGHAAGDALLKVVGARLARAVRDADHVCRQGGDEFVCLLPDVQQESHALAIAAKLRLAVSQPCELGLPTGPVRVHASVGVALFPQHGDTLQALMAGADHAMLRAKVQHQGVALASLPGLAPAGPLVRF